MATNLAIDPALLDRAVQVSGERTKKATGSPAVARFKKPMSCCSLYLLVLMSVTLQK